MAVEKVYGRLEVVFCLFLKTLNVHTERWKTHLTHMADQLFFTPTEEKVIQAVYAVGVFPDILTTRKQVSGFVSFSRQLVLFPVCDLHFFCLLQHNIAYTATF